MDREYLTQPEDVVRSLIGNCVGCLAAREAAVAVVQDWVDGEISAGSVELEYDLRVGARCGNGLIELTDVSVCPIDLPSVEERLPVLRALD